MSDPARTLPSLLAKSRVVVMLGAGGVGKTTTAIAMAMLAATQGRRVALLSIDPAKRLAAALGIPLGNQLAPVALPPGLAVASGGSLEAAMLDQKAVFDSMVRRSAKSPEIAAKILAHPLYRAASTNLSGPLEYMALAKLQELADDPRYDLVVLDTPPDTHALDFLARPNVLAGFMENKVMTWLIRPFLTATRFGLGSVLAAGERLMGGVAKITGITALHSFAEFLMLMQEVIEGFHHSGQRIVQLLGQGETTFALVTIPTLAAARSARHLGEELERLGYGADVLICNRCLPKAVAAEVVGLADREGPLGGLAKRAIGEEQVCRDLAAAMRSRSKAGGALLIQRLEDQQGDLATPAALHALAQALARPGPDFPSADGYN